MAIYGISLYNTSKYGPGSPANVVDPFTAAPNGDPFSARSIVDYDVEPFTAEASDYDNISLTWKAPKGSWSEFRVLKNWQGFSVNENDGQILLSTTGAETGIFDTGVKPGEWHYYSLWVKSSGGTWIRSSVACTLMLQEHGLGDALFDNLPDHHRLLQGHMDDLPLVENDDLRRFLTVLGMGLDYVKTFYESMRYLNDPTRNRADQLLALAAQLGVDPSPTTPPALFRQRVLNAATLGREKGTAEEIRSVCSIATGWDLDILPGTNMMLNEDQSSFVHPQYDLWDSGVNYPANTRVAYNGFLYTAKTGGAYGAAQAPSGTNAANTWWTPLSGLVDTTLKAADGSFAGWAPVNFSGGAIPTDAVAVGVGIQSATDPSVSWANALAIQNTSATTSDIGARSAGGDLTKPENAVLRGVPVPRPMPWDSVSDFEIGDVVSYSDNVYVAERESTNVVPTNTSFWSVVSPIDKRVGLVVSAHVKGTDATSQAFVAYPVVDLFDIHGNRLGTLDGSAIGTQVYDALTRRPGTLASRATDAGGKTWTVQSGTWTTVTGLGLFSPAAGLATLTGNANGQVSVTITGGLAGLTQALVFRGTDASNYLKATRTGLYSVSAGTSTLLGTYSTAAVDGDRLTATFNGSAVTILRNGVGVLSVTSSFNSTGTLHGTLVS